MYKVPNIAGNPLLLNRLESLLILLLAYLVHKFIRENVNSIEVSVSGKSLMDTVLTSSLLYLHSLSAFQGGLGLYIQMLKLKLNSVERSQEKVFRTVYVARA